MALFNGADFLRPQLDSLAAQDMGWRLWIGCDGSDDGSHGIIADFRDAHPDRTVALTRGPGQGPAANFRALLRNVPEDIAMVAFCDQDDVWLPDKLSRAAQALAPCEGPAIWCSRATICDAGLRPVGVTPLLTRAPSFRNALVQNVVIGHTLTLNRAALDLVRRADAVTGPIVMHDWWIYQLVTGAGGRVIRDERPSTLYRQHPGNAVGAPAGWRRRAAALSRMFSDRQHLWNRQMLNALTRASDMLTPENRQLLAEFRKLNGGGLPARLTALQRAAFYRQGRGEQAALWLAAVLGRI